MIIIVSDVGEVLCRINVITGVTAFVSGTDVCCVFVMLAFLAGKPVVLLRNTSEGYGCSMRKCPPGVDTHGGSLAAVYSLRQTRLNIK